MNSKTIADAARKSSASFEAIEQISAAQLPERLNNEDSRSRYDIWASNLGSIHPATDRRSADYRLREAPEVTDRIVELLEELTEINSEIHEILSGERANRQTSESEDDIESTDELSELRLGIGDIITSLFKVSMLVKKATKRDRYAKAASAKDDPFLVEFDIRHIADKYPKVRSQPWLLERLGKAITQRRQFLRYCRNHKNRIAHVAPISASKDSHLPKSRVDGDLEVPAHTGKAPSTTNTPLTRPTLSPTTASTLYPDKIVREDLQDLDDGDDAVSQVTSVAYSHVDSEDPGLIHVPRLEDVTNGGQPFECPFCFGIVQAKRQRSWRKHVLSDLRAYVCMSRGCDAGLFEDKATWQAHDAACHQCQWRCQHCRVGPFSSASGLQNHLRSSHDIGEFPEDILAQVVDASTSSLTEIVPDCPLCDFEDQVRADAMKRGQELSPDAQVVVPLADYHRHLAFHQEQLALFAMPPATESSAESASTHARSREDPDEHVQLMMRWKDRLTDTEDYFEEADDVASDSANKTALEVPSSSDFQSPSEHGDLAVTQDVAIGESTMDMPEEDQLPTIRPGDIVYIPQQTEERLLYMKAIYLGSNGQKFIAREWNSKQEVEVSMSALVPKTSFTEEERLEAEYLLATSAHGGRESQVGPRQHPRNILLSSQTIEELKLIAHQLETGEVELQEYDEGLVKPIFSKFLQQVNTRDSSHGLPLEDVVRIFYATTTSYFSEDNESTDQIWKADVERSAALLMDVLIGIVREGSDHSDEELAQIKAEHGQMIARASQAAKGARGDYIKQSVGELQDALDHLEIESETVEALKTRAHGVATGQEQLPGFGDKIVRQSFAKFSRRLKPTTPRGRHLVVEIMQEFESCVLSELIQLGRFEVGSTATTEALLKHKALLLSLLISVDAQLQFQHHGSAPRIRSRFTSLLMEERATYLLAISKERNESTNEPKKEPLNPRLLTNAPESHAKRTIFLQHIHKNIVRSNLELKSSTQPIQDIPPDRLKLLALSDQEVITLALDEEEKAAINQPEVYANIIKSRIAAYRNMKPEAFVDIVAQINRGKPVHTGLTDDRVPDVSSEELDADHRIAPHTEPSAIERPPRVMKCYQCQHSWTSTIAADFRDCPECGSYSVFADSPRRTASPDNTESPHRPKAHGEEAMGQYFSERTDKFMNLYRDKQPLPGSKQGSQESFPDPWSHLHGSHSSTSLSNAGMTKQDPLAADLHTTVCGSCGYRFSQSNILELVKCPKCNSKDTFVDLFSAEGRNHNQVEGIEASTQALHEAPPELTRLVHDIEDLAGDLKKLQDRHSSIVADVPVAVEQLLSLSAAFKLLIKLQEDPDHHIRFQRVQETVQVLCSSIQYTLEVASEALHVPFNETQWMFLCRRMQSDENVEFLERLRWYQKSASGLLEHVEGYTSMGLSARDANIESLLKRQQRTLEKPQSRTPLANLCSEPEESSATAPGSISCYSCHAQLSDVHKNADCPNCGSLTTAPPIPKIPLERMETEEAELVQRWKVSETAESAQIPQVYISRLLFGLIINARDAAGKLQALNKQYPHDSTGISAIVDQLMGLCGGFRRLSKLYEDSRNDSESAKAQGATQTICLSVQYTLDDVLGVFDTDSHETKWESWTRLTVQKNLMEKAGLSERLQWYLAAVLGLSHRLEGITSAGKISQWLGADEKIAALLERQERFLKTSQPATSSTIQLPAPTGLPDNQLPVAPLDVSDTNTKSRRPFDGFPTYELPSEATDTNTRSRRPYDDFPTDQLPAAPLEAFDTNTKYRRPFDGFPTDDRFEYEDHHPEGS